MRSNKKKTQRKDKANKFVKQIVTVSPAKLNEYIYARIINVSDMVWSGMMLCNGPHAEAASRLLIGDTLRCYVPLVRDKASVYWLQQEKNYEAMSDWVWVPVWFLWATAYDANIVSKNSEDVVLRYLSLTDADIQTTLFEAQLVKRYEQAFKGFPLLCNMAKQATENAIEKKYHGAGLFCY